MPNFIKKYILFSKIGSASIDIEAAHHSRTVHEPRPAYTPRTASTPEPVGRLQDHPHNFGEVRWGLRIFAVGLLLTAVLAAAFFVGAKGSFAKINLAGIPIEPSHSQVQIEQHLAKAAASYKIAFKYPDGSIKKYPLSETGVSVATKRSAANAKQVIAHSFVQRLQWWKPIEIPVLTELKVVDLQKFINSKATTIKQLPKDATLSINDDQVVIGPEAAGSGNQLPNAKRTIFATVAQLNQVPLVLKPAVLPPSITAKDLASSQKHAQSIIAQPVSFTIAGNTVTPSPADIAGWLDLNPVPQAKTVDVSVNSGHVLEYINSSAKRFISLPRARLVANTNTGQVVLDGGADGIDVVNKDKAASDIAKDIMAGKAVNKALDVEFATAKTVEAEVYPKWFVADVTTKRMYAYEGTNLVRTLLISAGAPATPTVTGQYAIYAKFASQNMTGANADGSRYNQAEVPFVNYFYKDYAIHGNYWRPSNYFGNINSSHGCLGAQVDDAAWVHDWAPIGTPVIVHT